MTPPRPPANSTWRTRPDIAAATIDGETAVYDPVAGSLHLLDASATAVWHRLDGDAPLHAVAADLAAATAASPEVVERDVLDLVRRLDDLGLVQRTGTVPTRDRASDADRHA